VEVRVDQWLWAVRLCSTRTEATELCRAGRIRVNGRVVKAAAHVVAGDRVEGRIHQRDRVIEVVRLIDKRVGAPIAVECYVDHSPAPASEDDLFAPRDRGAGRPTKRERRRLDQWRTGRGR
jgi:ribosome-associated heat shock protein Hsp15